MIYGLTVFLGICLGLVGFLATTTRNSSGIVPWLDVIIGLSAIMFVSQRSKNFARARFANGPVLYGTLLYVLGAVAVVTPTSPWLPWCNFAIGSTFLLIGFFASSRFHRDVSRTAFGAAEGYHRPIEENVEMASGPIHAETYAHGPRFERTSEEKVLKEISDALSYHVEVDSGAVEVELAGAAVSLRGYAPDVETSNRVVEIVGSVMGVRDVRNEMKVGGGSEISKPNRAA